VDDETFERIQRERPIVQLAGGFVFGLFELSTQCVDNWRIGRSGSCFSV
jgi:hypothetical protein